MNISTAPQNSRPSSQSGRASFSLGPRRSASIHSLHQSFRHPALSLNSTPTLKKLGAKLFHRKASFSGSSISTGPITTATSLSPPTSEGQLSLVQDPNSPVARQSNLPQLVTRHSNPPNKSNVPAHSLKTANPSGLKSRSSSFIGVTNRSQSFSSLTQLPNLKKQAGHHQPFVMDDDPDYFQNLSQSATPNLKSQNVSHMSANGLHIPSTPATPLEKPEFQTEYARRLFCGTADHHRYITHEDEDEELANPSSGPDLNPIHQHPTSRNRASRGSISSLGRANINTTSSTVISQDASSEQSQSPHLASRRSQPFRRLTSSASIAVPFKPPSLSSSQTPAVNSTLDSGSARPNSTFQSSVRRKVDGFKAGMKLWKPSRVSVDEANCLVSPDDASKCWGNECQNPTNSSKAAYSQDALPSFSVQPRNIQAPYPVNKPPARPLSVRSSIHRHLSATRSSSPTRNHQLSHERSNNSNPSTRDHQAPPAGSENDAFAAGSPNANNQKPIPHSQLPPPGPLRLRPGRMPLQPLDLDFHACDHDQAPTSTSQSRQAAVPGSVIHRAVSSSTLQFTKGPLESKEDPQVPGSQINLNRRRSPIIHESSNDLRRQIAREVNGSSNMAPSRTYSDGRLPASITPSSTRMPSSTIRSLNPSRNSIQRLSVSNDSAFKPSSSKYSQPNPSYQQHQQYLQHQNNQLDQNSYQQPAHRHYPSSHFSSAAQLNQGNLQIPVTPAGPPSQRGSTYATPNLNYRWSSSALSSTVQQQQQQRVERRPPPCSQSPGCSENEESEEYGEIPCHSQAPSRNSQLLSNQRQFYVHEDEHLAHNRHIRVPVSEQPDRPMRKHTQEPNRLEKDIIVVNNVEYNRQCVIGRGGSSKVFRASMNDGSSKLVAIKVVGLKQSDNQTYLTFCNEIELLKRLRGNDRIINLIDSAMDDARRKVWLVMELGETDLNQLLNRQMGKPISFRFIKHIWEQMLQAVQAVHDQEIIHTDLKPANFVLVQGSVKIIDFGIAKAIPADTTNISRETQIGTANYMSPEALIMQQFGDRQTVKMGRATDVWALGCILYQMVYGHTPFSKLDTGLKVHTIRDPKHVIDYPESVTPVEVTPEGQKVMLHEHKVIVEKEAIATMKACLTYRKEQRPEIPELLEHAFLLGPSLGTSTLTSDNISPRRITIPTSMIDDIIHKAWDWHSRMTANGNRLSDNQKNKFIASIKDSIQSSQ